MFKKRCIPRPQTTRCRHIPTNAQDSNVKEKAKKVLHGFVLKNKQHHNSPITQYTRTTSTTTHTSTDIISPSGIPYCEDTFDDAEIYYDYSESTEDLLQNNDNKAANNFLDLVSVDSGENELSMDYFRSDNNNTTRSETVAESENHRHQPPLVQSPADPAHYNNNNNNNNNIAMLAIAEKAKQKAEKAKSRLRRVFGRKENDITRMNREREEGFEVLRSMIESAQHAQNVEDVPVAAAAAVAERSHDPVHCGSSTTKEMDIVPDWNDIVSKADELHEREQEWLQSRSTRDRKRYAKKLWSALQLRRKTVDKTGSFSANLVTQRIVDKDVALSVSSKSQRGIMTSQRGGSQRGGSLRGQRSLYNRGGTPTSPKKKAYTIGSDAYKAAPLTSRSEGHTSSTRCSRFAPLLKSPTLHINDNDNDSHNHHPSRTVHFLTNDNSGESSDHQSSTSQETDHTSADQSYGNGGFFQDSTTFFHHHDMTPIQE